MESPLLAPEALDSLSSDVVILDARPAAAFAAGHLPGAIHADLERQLSSASENGDPARGGRHPLPPLDRWLRQVAAWGITPLTTVIVYDDQSGANAGARAWWMLRAIGHSDVRVLDGDWRGAAEPAGAQPGSAGDALRTIPGPPDSWRLPTRDMNDVDRLRSDAEWLVLDVRSAERFRGESEPIDPIAGRIPGALNLPFAENLEGGRFKSPEALRTQYAELFGEVPAERVVVHCGSGVTACHTLLALEVAGMPGASLYVGSWGEWCRNAMPQATGA